MFFNYNFMQWYSYFTRSFIDYVYNVCISIFLIILVTYVISSFLSCISFSMSNESFMVFQINLLFLGLWALAVFPNFFKLLILLLYYYLYSCQSRGGFFRSNVFLSSFNCIVGRFLHRHNSQKGRLYSYLYRESKNMWLPIV